MRRIRSNRLSKYIRPIFELKPIRNTFGIFIAILTIAFAFVAPQSVASEYSQSVIEDLTISASTIELTTTQAIRYPLDNAVKINQSYHSGHPAVDLDGNIGDLVYPITQGQVTQVIIDQHAYGHHVIISHSAQLTSLYAHLSKIYVYPGDQINTQTVIGQIGITGASSGSHLHLEVTDQGKHINPLSLLEINNKQLIY